MADQKQYMWCNTCEHVTYAVPYPELRGLALCPRCEYRRHFFRWEDVFRVRDPNEPETSIMKGFAHYYPDVPEDGEHYPKVPIGCTCPICTRADFNRIFKHRIGTRAELREMCRQGDLAFQIRCDIEGYELSRWLFRAAQYNETWPTEFYAYVGFPHDETTLDGYTLLHTIYGASTGTVYLNDVQNFIAKTKHRFPQIVFPQNDRKESY